MELNLFLAGATLGLASLAILVVAGQKKKVFQARFSLIGLIVCLGLNAIHPVLFVSHGGIRDSLPLEPLQFLLAPLSARYVLISLKGEQKLKILDFCNLLPAIFAVILLNFGSSFGLIDSTIAILLWSGLVIQLLFYFVPISKMMHDYQRSLKERVSNLQHTSLVWFHSLYFFVICTGGLYLTFSVLSFHKLNGEETRNFLSLMMLILTGVLSFRSISQVEPPTLLDGINKNLIQIENGQKIATNILALMEKSKVYLQPELTLLDLAEILGENKNSVSFSINQVLGKSFHDLINSYRVAEFIRLASDPQKKDEKIITLAFDSGFNSKPTFNKVVLAITGKTPKELRT